MYTKQEIIIRSYREGKSQRQISRELQISRKTVRKYLGEHEEALQTAVSEAAGRTINLSRALIYKKAQPRTKIKLTREVESAIDRLLEKNEQKKQQGQGKQLLKKKDILEALQGQGYEIGYTTVCN
ncbi:MAG: response regulator transcription factor [Dysgonomonadaceae bacterium]|nr:response regulator transcription factor [Dysgonamonadaceae bacterium]MBP9030751.1 response regulator transcription factor [Dysgonamonadaceae bacterium]